MTELLIDDTAIELIRKELIKENAFAMRIFIGGGGCCKHFEIIPVKKALSGDITFIRAGSGYWWKKKLRKILQVSG